MSPSVPIAAGCHEQLPASSTANMAKDAARLLGSDDFHPSPSPPPHISEYDYGSVWGRSHDTTVSGLPEDCLFEVVKSVLSCMGVSPAPTAGSGSVAGGPCGQFRQLTCTCPSVVCQSSGMHSLLHYLDDFLFLGQSDSGQCQKLLSAFQPTCEQLGIPLTRQRAQ